LLTGVEPANLAFFTVNEDALALAARLPEKAAFAARPAIALVVFLIDADSAAASLRQIADVAAGAAVVGVALIAGGVHA
jgi:hypothetical protein